MIVCSEGVPGVQLCWQNSATSHINILRCKQTSSIKLGIISITVFLIQWEIFILFLGLFDMFVTYFEVIVTEVLHNFEVPNLGQ